MSFYHFATLALMNVPRCLYRPLLDAAELDLTAGKALDLDTVTKEDVAETFKYMSLRESGIKSERARLYAARAALVLAGPEVI